MERRGAANALGRRGEELAATFLLEQGYTIIARNVTLAFGEIDLLAEEGDVIVLVEVKSQDHVGTVEPIYRISPHKQHKLRQLAGWVESRYPEKEMRVDAITVTWPDPKGEPILTHLENILES